MPFYKFYQSFKKILQHVLPFFSYFFEQLIELN